MRARLVTTLGLVAVAATHLWCTASGDAEPPPPEDGGAETGPAPDAEPADAGDAGPGECTEDGICLVAFPFQENGPVSLNGLWAKSASEVWVVGSTGFAARFDGTEWRRVPTGTRAPISGVVGTEDGIVWGAGSGRALLKLNREKDGEVEVHDGGFVGYVEGLSALGAELYAVGPIAETFDYPFPPPYDIWHYGPGPGGGTPEWSSSGASLCPHAGEGFVCPRFHAVWAESAERLWFAGENGKVFRTETSPPDPDAGGEGDVRRLRLVETNSRSLRRLSAIWGLSGDDIWAVGHKGVVRHWDGESWAVVSTPAIGNLYGVWGGGASDVWAVGEGGTVIHWNGEKWSAMKVPFAPEKLPRLYAVVGAGPDVWIAGEGVLLRWSGAVVNP